MESSRNGSRRPLIPTHVLLKFEFPKWQRDHALPPEVADVIKFTTHQTVGAVGGEYGVHVRRLGWCGTGRRRLSTTVSWWPLEASRMLGLETRQEISLRL